MLGLLIRGLLVVAGFFASFIVARDSLNFPIFQMVIAVLLFSLFIAILAFWPMIKEWFLSIIKKSK